MTVSAVLTSRSPFRFPTTSSQLQSVSLPASQTRQHQDSIAHAHASVREAHQVLALVQGEVSVGRAVLWDGQQMLQHGWEKTFVMGALPRSGQFERTGCCCKGERGRRLKSSTWGDAACFPVGRPLNSEL